MIFSRTILKGLVLLLEDGFELLHSRYSLVHELRNVIEGSLEMLSSLLRELLQSHYSLVPVRFYMPACSMRGPGVFVEIFCQVLRACLIHEEGQVFL